MLFAIFLHFHYHSVSLSPRSPLSFFCWTVTDRSCVCATNHLLYSCVCATSYLNTVQVNVLPITYCLCVCATNNILFMCVCYQSPTVHVYMLPIITVHVYVIPISRRSCVCIATHHLPFMCIFCPNLYCSGVSCMCYCLPITYRPCVYAINHLHLMCVCMYNILTAELPSNFKQKSRWIL